MKKILVAGLLLLSGGAFAHGFNGYYHHHHHGSNHWVAPLIVGGVVGYALSRPQVVQPVPVTTYPPVTTIPTVQTQTCTAWVETMNQDGTIIRTRTCSN